MEHTIAFFHLTGNVELTSSFLGRATDTTERRSLQEVRSERSSQADLHSLRCGTLHVQFHASFVCLLLMWSNVLKLRSSVPEGMCMRLSQPQKSSRDQLSEVLEFFNVVVREEDIFSRCLVSHSLPHCLKHAVTPPTLPQTCCHSLPHCLKHAFPPPTLP